MQILLPSNLRKSIRQHLVTAGAREIGGILMGEDLGSQCFRVVDYTVDLSRGTESQFSRDAEHHEQELNDFFQKTNRDFRRFNYLGEWHTHPQFSLKPSLQDLQSMMDLVQNSTDVGFAVLLIARLNWYRRLQCGATFFNNTGLPEKVAIKNDTAYYFD